MSAKNMAASVATRLLNRARARNEDYQFLLTRYALERLTLPTASRPDKSATTKPTEASA